MAQPDRIPSDHPSIQTIRATVARHGGRRRRIEIDGDDADRFPAAGTVVRIVIDGRTRFSRLESGRASSDRWISGLYDSPTYARSPDAPGARDRLTDWLDEHDRSVGRSLLVDVIEPDFAYGLREPGDRAVYQAVEKPSDSLSSIAESLEDR